MAETPLFDEPTNKQTEPKRKMTAYELRQMLAKKYCAPEYAFFAELPAATGGATRRADGFSISLWKSRGIYFTGFEIKVARSDWLNELKNPKKAEAIGKFCDYWYIVAPDTSVVKLHELPETWGLMTVDGRGLCIKKQAVKIDAEPMTRNFLASLFRQMDETINPERELRQAENLGFRKGLEVGQNNESERWQKKYADMETKAQQYATLIREFEQATGIRLNSYHFNSRDLGAAVSFLMEGGFTRLEKEISQIKHAAKVILNDCEKIDEYNEKWLTPIIISDDGAILNENIFQTSGNRQIFGRRI